MEGLAPASRASSGVRPSQEEAKPARIVLRGAATPSAAGAQMTCCCCAQIFPCIDWPASSVDSSQTYYIDPLASMSVSVISMTTACT